jgi:Spy/CpxP family protein refolding chaperone
MGMGIMPPGTWWRRPEIIQTLSLSSEQQKNLDSIFLQSRTQLVQMHATLEEQQLQLEPLLAANPVDDARVMTIVAKIADTRAELEKANAKMLLSLRKVLTSDQWTKLQAMRPEHRWGGGQEFKRRGGPDGPGGPPTPPAPTGGEGGEQ